MSTSSYNKSGNAIQRHLREVQSSIKLADIEEKYDIYFSRFFGLFIAKIAGRVGLHPDHISVLSLLTGMLGAALLYYQSNLLFAILAALFITLSGVLDSADGQLARLSKKSSEFGRALDGTIDTLVFTSLYLAGIAFVLKEFDGLFFIVAIGSLYVHGVKTAIYEFYKSEYLRFVALSTGGHTPMSIKEVKLMGTKGYHYMIHLVLLLLASAQLTYTLRNKSMRLQMIGFSEADPSAFKEAYQKANRKMMPLWAWTCGLNVHRNGIVFFSLFGRFDLYIYANLIWTIMVIPVSYMQLRRDQRLIEKMENDTKGRGATSAS